jgi:rhodanese-related sulfurtransferase
VSHLVRNQPVARVLYRALITEGLHGGVSGLARRLGLPASTLYAYAEGTIPLPVWLLAPLWSATRDPALLAELVGADGVTLSEAAAPGVVATDSALAAACRVGQTAGAAQGALVQAIADGVVTEVEHAAVEKRIDELEREAETLRAVLRSPALRVVGVRR